LGQLVEDESMTRLRRQVRQRPPVQAGETRPFGTWGSAAVLTVRWKNQPAGCRRGGHLDGWRLWARSINSLA